MNKNRIYLLLILFLAFLLRFYNFWQNPPGLYWDEVAIGFNAKSILTTGSDEYGHKFPLLFESFQDFKLPGYVYLLVPFVKLIGLSTVSVRLPSILLGVLTIYLIYLLCSVLFTRKVALLSALLLSLSSWHLQFSRAGFEANAGLTVVTFGIYFLVKGLKQIKWFPHGVLFLVLSLYFYYSQRVFVPLFLASFIFLFWQKIKSFKKQIFLSFVIGGMFFLPLLVKFLGASSVNRFSQVSIFSDEMILASSVAEKEQDKNSFLSRVLHHRYLVYTLEITRNYLSHFSFDFLFWGHEANLRHHVPQVGYLPLWTLPLIIVGIYTLVKERHYSLKILVPWIIFSPLLSSATLPSPHALRSLLMVPVSSVFIAYGIYVIFVRTNPVPRFILSILLTSFLVFSVLFYLHQLFIHYPRVSSREWAYGYKEVFEYIKAKRVDYQNIYITGKYWRPYIFALFYLDYPAKMYQKNPVHHKIDNLYFGHATYDTSDAYYDYQEMEKIRDNLRNKARSLLILSPDELLPIDNVVKTINDLSGEPLFLFVET